MLEALQYDFMRHALAAGLLVSLLCGVMGALAVVNRLVFLSGGIAHASYGGIGLALYFGLPVLACTFGFALVAALGMALVTLRARHRADTIIGVTWALGMALGVLLVDLTPGYNADLMGYLFGSILAVPTGALWAMAGAVVVVAGFATWFYPELLALSYDEEFARVRGVPVARLYLAMVALLSLAIVLAIQVVGLILVIALLTIPPFILERRSRSLGRLMLGSAGLGALFCVAGLALAYAFDLSSGAAIILVAGVVFFMALGLGRLRRLRPHSSET